MTQSGVIFLTTVVGFVVFITLRGKLREYGAAIGGGGGAASPNAPAEKEGAK